MSPPGVRTNVETIFVGGRRSGGGPTALGAARTRRKAPIQFCPVPGCKNRAAPVFGMVCADHKNVAKSKIRKYREERKQAKNGKTARASTKAKSARSSKPGKAKRKTSTPKRVARTLRKTPAGKKVVATAPVASSLAAAA